MNASRCWTSNGFLLSQNAGLFVPTLVGQMPWIVHRCSLNVDAAQMWSLFCSAKKIHRVTGHCCVNIRKSKSWFLSAINTMSTGGVVRLKFYIEINGFNYRVWVTPRHNVSPKAFFPFYVNFFVHWSEACMILEARSKSHAYMDEDMVVHSFAFIL